MRTNVNSMKAMGVKARITSEAWPCPVGGMRDTLASFDGTDRRESPAGQGKWDGHLLALIRSQYSRVGSQTT